MPTIAGLHVLATHNLNLILISLDSAAKDLDDRNMSVGMLKSVGD